MKTMVLNALYLRYGHTVSAVEFVDHNLILNVM